MAGQTKLAVSAVQKSGARGKSVNRELKPKLMDCEYGDQRTRQSGRGKRKS